MITNNRRITAFCLLAIIAIWGIFCWPWLLDGRIIPYDAKNHFYPMIRFVAEAWHSGADFGWSPHHYGGFPMIADPQSAIWTPTFWIPTFISATPSMHLVDAIHLLHLLVGAFAIFGFGKISAWRWEASLIAALIYMMAGPSSLRLEHMLMTVSYMWLAVALWRLKAVLVHGGAWRGIAFGIALALLLIDRNHVAYLGAWLLFIYWLAAVFSDFKQPRPNALRRVHLPITIGGILALVLIAVPVILLLQLANDSNRPEFSYLQASWQSLHPAALFSFVLPEYFGSLRLDGGKHWGPPSTIWGEKGLKIHRGMLHMYCGMVPLVAIIWFGILKRQLLRGEARFFTIACLICVLYALGRYTPVFRVLYDAIPGVDLFRRPADALFIFGFSLALLTGALVQQGLAMRPYSRSLWLTSTVILALIALFAAMFRLAYSLDRLADFANSLIVPTAVVAGSILAMALTKRSGKQRQLALIALVGIVAADLVYHSSNTRINARPSEAYQVLERAEEHPIFAHMLPLLDKTDPLGIPWRTEIIGLGPVVQNLPQIIHSQGLLGYNPLRLSGFEQHIAPDMQNNASLKRNFGDRMTGYSSPLANQLGLRYVISGAPLHQIDPAYDSDHFTLIGTAKYKWRTAYFYENTRALPRVAVVSDTGTSLDREISVLAYENTHIALQVKAGAAGTLVLRDFHYPGWSATVNGQKVQVSKQDDLFRAIPLPAGSSRVEFQFNLLTRENLLGAAKALASAP
ncbi:hypothetical protein SAMN04488118_107198 [Epibacterium ulvae]|uniref:YfhO family protein n=1 Tax=Epibacterium ulvae TaxID=1156985 RepID=A0A1G5R429_9RHOB|nr:hypothetical protein [Epibacterium ulvae]SCZ68211.1 hypothetical protein SAMN04488118_107198 [Epibacterium ulvae]